jgi:hypothetical protein
MSVHQKETLFQSHLQGLFNGGVLQGIHHGEFVEKLAFGNSKRQKKPTAPEQQPTESLKRQHLYVATTNCPSTRWFRFGEFST